MYLKLTKFEKKFLGRWVLANSISFPVGIIVAIVLSYAVVNLFYPKETNLIVGICLGGIVGFSQWFVLKKYIKIGIWWIFSCSIGIGIPFIVAVVIFELTGTDPSIVGVEIIDHGIVMFIGGLITGLLQVRMVSDFSSKGIWWIIISGFAWGIGWFGLILGGAVLGLISGIALLKIYEFPIEEE